MATGTPQAVRVERDWRVKVASLPMKQAWVDLALFNKARILDRLLPLHHSQASCQGGPELAGLSSTDPDW